MLRRRAEFYDRNLARSSSRLYNIVCTPLVWKRLLRGIEDFTKAKVDDNVFQPSSVVELRSILSRRLSIYSIIIVMFYFIGQFNLDSTK